MASPLNPRSWGAKWGHEVFIMPLNVVKTPEDEKKWEKAEAIAASQGNKGNYAYVMGIYKRMNPDHKFKTAAFPPPPGVLRG